MKKGIFSVLVVVLLSAGFALAHGWPPTEVEIGTAQPEVTLPTNVGWDNNPAAGNWGGRGADHTFAVAWEYNSPDVPLLFGRFAEVTIPGQRGVVPTRIEIGYLAGIANDDFCVLASVGRWTNNLCPHPNTSPIFIAVGCINEDETNTNEVWKVTGPTDLVLPANIFHAGQDITIQIRVTGNAWWGFGTWGQLAIDRITVYGVHWY